MLETVAEMVVLPILALSVLLTAVRLVIGPTLADRVVALELLATIGIALAAVYAFITKQYELFDVAVVIGLISFLGTIAFAHYLSRTMQRGRRG